MRTPRAQAVKRAEDFARGCKKAGLQQAGCGVGVRDLLQQLRQGPLTCGRSRAGVSMPHAAAMGPAVRAGLARYHAAELCFVISPAGETWLEELEVHGLAGKAEARVHCWALLGLVALLPEIEPHWQAWFWLGALFGAGAWVLYRMVQWVDQDMRQEKMDGHGRESVEASQARQRARVLTESEHRELLLTALADAMRNPMRRVDIRGVPALWALTDAQKAVWLAWLRGKELEWAGHHWVATVERVGHLVFVRFEVSTEGGSLSGEIQARKQTDKIIVARGRASRS